MRMNRLYPGAGDPGRQSARAWVKGKVEENLLTMAEPRPGIYVVFPDHVDAFDFSAAVAAEGEGHAGATYHQLLASAGGAPVFLVLRVDAQADGRPVQFAVVVEVYGTPARARVGWLPYELGDHNTATAGDWQEHDDVIPLTSVDPPFEELFRPPIGARPFVVEPPELGPTPVQAAFLTRPLPTDPQGLAELAAREVVGGLIAGRLPGTTIVRTCGDECEVWNIGDPARHGAPLDELIRFVANRPDDDADGVAMVMAAIFESGPPGIPHRGIQILAEHVDGVVERRLYLSNEVPPRVVHDAQRVLSGKAERWLGVAPTAELDLTLLEQAGEA